MAALTINDNPTITDTVIFSLPCSDVNNCFTSDPYKVNSVVIYYVERDFASGNFREYQQAIPQSDKLQAAVEAEAIACASPTDQNIATAKKLRAESDATATVSPFFYNEAKPVKVIGNKDYPAWLSSDQDNAFITHVTEDDNGNTVYGQFTYEWNPVGMREGDYFICWTWTPLPAGDQISQHERFILSGNTVVTTSIPSHYTVPDKYENLLDKYLPDIFKQYISADDQSPVVLEKFNKSVARGFTDLEDLANQVVDLMDANSTHEMFLPLLSNFFGIKLKSDDPTLWRRQIREAVRLYKMKGTRGGLESALAQAAIRLVKLTKLWQVTSLYTWQESFKYSGDDTFVLAKNALSIDEDNFGLWLRPAGEETYVSLSSDYVSFETVDGVTSMTWAGNSLSVDPIDLVDGDIVRVLYLYQTVPGSTEQTIENYIRSLPLSDQRDENDQSYPKKNWNVRLIEEDDPFFSVVIANRHPYYESLVYGKVRTEFPYSENLYNMDEFNGSIRNSKSPCDIDKDFLDPCSACQSSKFNIDLEIQNLNNDRILEAQDVIREFSPFHAVLHTMRFTGGVNEFVQPPLEAVEILVQYNGSDFVISGQGQMWFNRNMLFGKTTRQVLRNQLADSESVYAGTGTGYNEDITIFCPDLRFDRIGMATDGTAVLEIMSPSPNAGSTTLSLASGHTAVVASATEPLNTSSFTFRVSNVVTDGTMCNIYQDNIFVFSDSTQNFGVLGVKSSWDVNQGTAPAAWSVYLPDYSATPYEILDILPDGSLILSDDGTLPGSGVTNLTYTVKTPTSDVLSATSGKLAVTARGRVKALDSDVQDVQNLFKSKIDYVVTGGNQYVIYDFVKSTDDEFYILGYSDGDASGTTLTVYQRLADNQVGYLSHRGMKFQVSGNLESSLSIQNGRNGLDPDSMTNVDRFKENFLVVIDGEYYFISDIDGDSPSGSTTITLSGPDSYWKSITAGGTSLGIEIFRYMKNPVTIPGQQFDLPPHTFPNYDRGGREVIDRIDQEGNAVGIQSADDFTSEAVSQAESIGFSIQWADGSTDTGEI